MKKALGITAGVLALIFVAFVGCAALVGTAADKVDEEMSRPVKVTYEVTGTSTDASITYSTWQNDSWGTAQEGNVALPWRKEVTSTGWAKGGSLTVSTGMSGGSVTCTLTVEGQAPVTSTASGQFTHASCFS
jgi:hypothetical protein